MKKDKKPSVSAIIPFYNEGRRVLRVLKEVSAAKSIGEIIAIDDGSHDRSFEAIRKRFPGIRLIRLPKNKGKAAAVHEGAKHAAGELVLLLDADLKNLRSKELDKASELISKNKKIDMLILRCKDVWPLKISGVDILISGQRLLRKKDLLEVFKKRVSRYRLELAINAFFLRRKKRIFWMPFSAGNTLKIKKVGLIKGLEKELAMFSDLISYAGTQKILEQLLKIRPKKIKAKKPAA